MGRLHPPYENDEADLSGQGGAADPFPEALANAGELRGLYKLALAGADAQAVQGTALEIANEALDFLTRIKFLLSDSERLKLRELNDRMHDLIGG